MIKVNILNQWSHSSGLIDGQNIRCIHGPQPPSKVRDAETTKVFSYIIYEMIGLFIIPPAMRRVFYIT